MRISDWSSACALPIYCRSTATRRAGDRALRLRRVVQVGVAGQPGFQRIVQALRLVGGQLRRRNLVAIRAAQVVDLVTDVVEHHVGGVAAALLRSEEHTSELQSLMRISSAVFCLKKKTKS